MHKPYDIIGKLQEIIGIPLNIMTQQYEIIWNHTKSQENMNTIWNHRRTVGNHTKTVGNYSKTIWSHMNITQHHKGTIGKIKQNKLINRKFWKSSDNHINNHKESLDIIKRFKRKKHTNIIGNKEIIRTPQDKTKTSGNH